MIDVEEKIIDYFTEYDYALNQLSFISQKTSNDIMKAFIYCEILVFNIDSVHKLIKISNSFLQFGKLMNFSKYKLEKSKEWAKTYHQFKQWTPLRYNY